MKKALIIGFGIIFIIAGGFIGFIAGRRYPTDIRVIFVNKKENTVAYMGAVKVNGYTDRIVIESKEGDLN